MFAYKLKPPNDFHSLESYVYFEFDISFLCWVESICAMPRVKIHYRLHTCVPHTFPFNGELQTQKLKSHLVRTQSLNILPLRPGVGQYVAIHATLTARDFFLVYFTLQVHSPALFPKPLPIVPVLAVASTGLLCRPAE